MGPSNLYNFGEGQRAGPTVHKKTESNRVLTRKPSITGLTAWKEARFHGDHFVECYAIKDGALVARAHISVPIE